MCRVATGVVDYPEVVGLLEGLLKGLTVEDRKLIFQENAIEFYGLQDVIDLS